MILIKLTLLTGAVELISMDKVHRIRQVLSDKGDIEGCRLFFVGGEELAVREAITEIKVLVDAEEGRSA